MMRLILFFALAFLLPAHAEARWREASTRHFLVYSEADEAELRRAAEQLERFDSMLRVLRGVDDPDRSPATRVTIVFVRDIPALQALLGDRDSGVGGFYLPRASDPMIVTPRVGIRSRRADSVYRHTMSEEHDSFTAQDVLLHEYTHHFMYNNFDLAAPLWLSEGYPEFYSTARFDEDGGITIGAPPLARGEELLGGIASLDAENILLRPAENYRNPAIYGIGWLMSHYLSFEPSRRGQLESYVRALLAGQEPEQAASAFGDLDRLTGELSRYRRSTQWALSTVPADRLTTGPIAIRALSEAEDAIMDVRIRSRRGVSRGTAPDVARDARRIAERYPNDPFVQVTLAEAEYDARNYDAAEAAADRALAANPNLVDALLFKARAIWGRAEAAEDRSPETWREVQRLLGAANRIDPGDPEPLMLFYESFEPAGMAPTENAVEGLLLAQEEAPQDAGLRMLATRELLAHDLPNRARLLMAPILHGAHGREDRAKVAAVMDLIRAGDSRAALAKLDELRAEAEREEEEDG